LCSFDYLQNCSLILVGMSAVKRVQYFFSTASFVIFFAIIFTSCKRDNTFSCEGVMFGRPVENTGLDYNKCRPVCECSGIASPLFTPDDISFFRSWQLSEPLEELTSNPYDLPAEVTEPCVCAVVVDNQAQRKYHLENFPSVAAAEAAGALVTHHDACGLCSTLEDLAVYAEDLDVGAPVRLCGIFNFNQPFDSLVACIELIGFSKPCAQIWAYNVINTQSLCFDFCISDQSYHLPDGSLSPCLECDEVNSGPVFKAVAGRTRRNTGIASSICRFCDEVQPVKHNYPR
jgi:hypothetical protein